MSNEIVVVGSCNIDFFSYVHKLPKPGETIKGKNFVTGFGGKGANQCVATSRLGGKTCFIARVGDDSWGSDYVKKLKEENVDTKHVQITNDTNTGIAQIAVEDSGENNIIIIAGANAKLCEQDIVNAADVLKRGGVLVMQLESPIETAKKAMELFGGISILNAAPAVTNIEPYLLTQPTILCVNETEAASITNLSVTSLEEAKAAIDKLLNLGCQSILLTLGAEGALYASQQSTSPIHVPSTKVTAIDTTGAGDAFIGGLAYMLANYRDIPMEKSIEVACQLAAISVQKPGTQSSYADQNDLKNILGKLKIQNICSSKCTKKS